MEERGRKQSHTEPAPSDPGSSTTSAAEATDDDSDKTDVSSEQFDPLLALYSPTVKLPFPNIKCFNNVAEYESFLKGGRGRARPETVERRRREAMKGVADLERIERLKKLMVNNPVPEASGSASRRKRRDKPQKNVLTRMPLCKGSPLGELHRCVEERIRVKVHIRTFKGLRGVCSGFVVAFDKFWNMAMVDVDETYRELLLGETFNHEKALTISRLFEKLKVQESAVGHDQVKNTDTQKDAHQPAEMKISVKSSSLPVGERTEERTAEPKPKDKKVPDTKALRKKDPQIYGRVHTRHINQLFIRGENVILVNPQPL